MASKNTEQDSENRTALIDSRTNYRRKRQPEPPKSGSCFSRLWIVLTVIFFTSTIALLAVLLWREFSKERSTETKFNIRVRFPGYFRTKEEQAAFVQLVTKTETVTIPVNQTVPSTSVFNLTCCTNSPLYKTSTPYPTTTPLSTTETTVIQSTTLAGKPQRRKRKAGVQDNSCCGSHNLRRKRAVTASGHYHGCCVSHTSFISPNKLENIHGVEKTLAQFPDMRQYFKQDNCKRATPCSGCECMNIMEVTTAVIDKENEVDIEDKYDIDFFKMIGCCKCLNAGHNT